MRERHAFTGRMIRPRCDKGVGERASFVRAAFSAPANPKDARLFISALGLYRAFINGVRVGDDQLTPGWTCYRERLAYQAYDVAALLKPGDNFIDIWLADGWLRSQMLWARNPIFNTWGGEIGAIADLVCDGAPIASTDATWRSGLLPILKSGIYFGEIFDARLERLTADSGVAPVAGFDPKVLIAHEIGGVKELAPFAPVASFTDELGRTIHDFGQNAAGYVSLKVRGEAGARVVVEHAEILDKGKFSNSNMRSAEARLEYVLKGEGVETYRPHFTFQGFRYARVSVEGKASVERIEAIPITSATETAGEFVSGHPLVNRLVQNTLW